jgi:predicted DNA-binding transcriptional regulator YafY
MNRTDRLLAMVLELQGKGRQRAEDLAATFEVSKRTIYRDIQALSEAGVPLVAVTGQGYTLVEGYFLPPLQFTVEEAVMLLLGSGVMARSFDAELGSSAHSAGQKIRGVLPERLRGEVAEMRESIHFVTEDGSGRAGEARLLPYLRRAILKRRSVLFTYVARQSAQGAGAETRREADPYALVHAGGAWYLVAYCHLRRSIRHFRLERMEDLAVGERSFVRPAGFGLQPGEDDGRNLVVRVLFAYDVARWVREARSYFAVAEEERHDGLLMTLQVRHEEDVLSWLLSWGSRALVVEPESLQLRVAEEAKAIVARYRAATDLAQAGIAQRE